MVTKSRRVGEYGRGEYGSEEYARNITGPTGTVGKIRLKNNWVMKEAVAVVSL